MSASDVMIVDIMFGLQCHLLIGRQLGCHACIYNKIIILAFAVCLNIVTL